MDLFSDKYRMIEYPVEGIFKDKGSKFIARIFPVTNESEIKQHLENLRKEFYDARHHCYAWVLGADKSAYRTNDDGEPSGSAGRPIYGQLISNDLTNILAVVIRYFGGTKLGIPGLINAYREAVYVAIAKATIVELTVDEYFKIKFSYPLMDLTMRILRDHGAQIIATDFTEDCKIEFSIRKGAAGNIVSTIEKTYGVQFIKDENN